MTELALTDFPLWFVRGFALAWGLIWGSFLNVVIYRVPRGMSVVRPPSHCPACGKPVRPWDNVPVLAFLFLRGRARCCGAKLSPRYVLVELIGGVLSLAILEAIVLRQPAGTPIGASLALYAADFTLAMGLVAAAFIDLEHMYLPDGVTVGGAVLGVATASLRGLDFTHSLLGAGLGFVLVWLPFIVGYRALRGRAGMGLGDAKLLALAGAWFGPAGAVIVLCAGALQGTLVTIGLLLARGRIEEPDAVREEREALRAELEAMTPEERAEVEKELADDPLAEEAAEGVGQARIAFGPFLVLAALEYLLVGDLALGAYLSWVGLA